MLLLYVAVSVAPEPFKLVVLPVVGAAVMLVVVIVADAVLSTVLTIVLIVAFVFDPTFAVTAAGCVVSLLVICMFAVDTLVVITGAIAPSITLLPTPCGVPSIMLDKPPFIVVIMSAGIIAILFRAVHQSLLLSSDSTFLFSASKSSVLFIASNSHFFLSIFFFYLIYLLNL